MDHRDHPAKIEVTRQVFGNVDKADNDGKVEMVDVTEKSWDTQNWPCWWNWYSWPCWWCHFNGTGPIQWTVKLGPGQHADLKRVRDTLGEVPRSRS